MPAAQSADAKIDQLRREFDQAIADLRHQIGDLQARIVHLERERAKR